MSIIMKDFLIKNKMKVKNENKELKMSELSFYQELSSEKTAQCDKLETALKAASEKESTLNKKVAFLSQEIIKLNGVIAKLNIQIFFPNGN